MRQGFRTGSGHASSCFEGVVLESYDVVPGLAVAVAARTRGPLQSPGISPELQTFLCWYYPPLGAVRIADRATSS